MLQSPQVQTKNNMKSKSTFSQNMDPYRAGIEIAENLKGINPEIIFLFSSIHYAGSEEMTEAIYDVMDSDELLIIGCSGDGFYERNMVANIGASALAINSNGAIHWQLEMERGVGLTPYNTTIRCFKRLRKTCPESRVVVLFSDFRTDASEVIRAVADSDIPVLGGMAGDDFSMETCFIYNNRQIVTDSVVMLALSGDFPFEIFAAHNMKPEGKIGAITKCQATSIQTINKVPAMHFVEEAMGKPLEHLDRGTITVNVIHPDNPSIIRHRSLLLPRNPAQDTEIQLFGGIAEGEKVQLCLTNPEEIIAEVKSVADGLDQLPFQPLAAIIISCAGRKHLLGNKNKQEISELSKAKKIPEAISGFPSLGEISPIKTDKGYSEPLFHNMTYVVFAFGEKTV